MKPTIVDSSRNRSSRRNTTIHIVNINKAKSPILIGKRNIKRRNKVGRLVSISHRIDPLPDEIAVFKRRFGHRELNKRARTLHLLQEDGLFRNIDEAIRVQSGHLPNLHHIFSVRRSQANTNCLRRFAARKQHIRLFPRRIRVLFR